MAHDSRGNHGKKHKYPRRKSVWWTILPLAEPFVFIPYSNDVRAIPPSVHRTPVAGSPRYRRGDNKFSLTVYGVWSLQAAELLFHSHNNRDKRHIRITSIECRTSRFSPPSAAAKQKKDEKKKMWNKLKANWHCDKLRRPTKIRPTTITIALFSFLHSVAARGAWNLNFCLRQFFRLQFSTVVRHFGNAPLHHLPSARTMMRMGDLILLHHYSFSH